jgi:hypothetical protein
MTTYFITLETESLVEAEAEATVIEKGFDIPETHPNFGTLRRFYEYAKDADNWSYTPLVGGNVGGDNQDKGFTLNMKKLGLITTWRDEGCTWMRLTESGKTLAKRWGIDIPDWA